MSVLIIIVFVMQLVGDLGNKKMPKMSQASMKKKL